MKSHIEQSYQFFKAKDYAAALRLYESLKTEYNTSIFDANIVLCKKKLGHDTHRTGTAATRAAISSITLPPLAIAPEFATARQQGNKICLIRVLGNDLPGLHAENQTIKNLEFILKNEPSFDGADKIFFLNKIVSEEKKKILTWMLKKHHCQFVEQQFDSQGFLKIPLCHDNLPGENFWQTNDPSDEWIKLCMERAKRDLRNAYLINNNGARNAALRFGHEQGYEWVFPLDGNCFLSQKQYEEIQQAIHKADAGTDYLVIPMERCLKNTPDLVSKEATNATEEPQIAFRRGAELAFDEDKVYGNQPKVDLLRKLGVPGVWDSWTHEYPWQPIVLPDTQLFSKKWASAASVFRLASGNELAAEKARVRGHVRAHAIINFIDWVHDYSQKKIKNNSTTDFLYYKKSQENGAAQVKTRHLNQIFDKIYLVSLGKCLDKRLKVQRQLMAMGVDYKLFPAVDGYVGEPAKKYKEYLKIPRGELKIFAEHAHKEKNRSTKLIESAGAMGYIYTYINIIKDAKKNKFKRILIVEDDVIFAENFDNKFSNFINKIPADWKILHLGASQYGWKHVNMFWSLENSFYHPRLYDTTGSFAIGLDESVYDEVIANQMAFEAPFDNLPMGVLYEKYLGKCFVAFPYLVMPDVSESTIRGKRDQYTHANRVRWWVGDFCYPQQKLNVGVVVSSPRNLKYLSQRHLFDVAPVTINLFHTTENGLLPLHEQALLGEDYVGGVAKLTEKNTMISVDILLEAQPTHIITVESICTAVEHVFANNPQIKGFKKLETEPSKIVEKRVSVILPTYKRPTNLARAIDSVLTQDYEDIELIVVDDNGEDSEYAVATRKVIEQCKAEYPGRQLKYLCHKTNANGATARNTGILHSSGSYICFLDDDDVYLPGRISASVAVLQYTNADVGGVYCGFLGWNAKEPEQERFLAGNLTRELLTLDYMRHYLHTNTATYKRSAVFHINGFDTSYRRHQDLEFNLRFFQHYKMDVVKQCLVRLSPEKSGVDNKVYDMDMFNLKAKFLRRFERQVNQFDDSVKQIIYMNNWHEVVRYAKDKESLLTQLRGDYSNAALQVVALSESGGK